MALSPISWYGGKYYIAQDIIDLFPKHRTYIEVFGGAGHILFKKNRSEIEVYNDIHEGLYNFFKIIRDEDKVLELIDRLRLTLYSRKEHEYCCNNWRSQENEIEKARMFFVALMQSFSSEFKQWSYCITESSRNMSSAVSSYIAKIDERLPGAMERFRTVQVENLDFRDLIPRYDTKESLFYLDPPYVRDTRSQKYAYEHEMSNQDHQDLVNILLEIKGKAIISGYENKIYEQLEEAGWNKKIIDSTIFASKRKKIKRESAKEAVWYNFEDNQLKLF